MPKYIDPPSEFKKAETYSKTKAATLLGSLFLNILN
jgi:hypothetical protein